jgi:hypothetical protein
MKLELEILDPLKAEAWDAIVREFPQSTVFHGAAWARVLMDAYGYRPHYALFRRDGRIEAAAPLMEVRGIWGRCKGVSLPFSDSCPPLVWEGIDFGPAFQVLLDYARAAGWRSLEFRGGPFAAAGAEFASATYYEHILALAGREDSLEAGFRSTTRRNVKKAREAGVKVSFSSSEEALGEYYRLHCLSRKHHGVPPQPYTFFRAIHRHLLAAGGGTVALAEYRGGNIGGAVYLYWGEKAIYKFGAMDRKWEDVRASYLVMAEAFERFRAEGFKEIGLGRTDLDDSGLRQFKTGWGCREEIVKYCRYDVDRGTFVKEPRGSRGVARKICRRLPVVVLRMAGSILYRYAG